ncbi:GIY-YIG nuclease family protein [Corynebacterium glucuronolyticum]|uniref:GIY-YIG nuclease family protein n=1 Tax=Corynebacterium glucuronolyticum TaxID=39791 RepID=A0A7T4EG60_9CORY|nr:GIY-YIG nuclease family protein [Corynebacterium glucuronolyticum]QQB46782.1 GIY-YIG nuclease family protein [Corynebacterium glucuronolyticum]WKD62385.1 hypothetical protein CGLUCO_00460 [Corynebacterium glucuronolyticum DSM 44120]SMB83314.1 T5orf172 domain-containing protein [Corynebacterium glucuronolyticum]
MATDDFLAKLDEILESDDATLLEMPEKPVAPSDKDRLKRAFQEVVDFYEREGREPDPDTYDVAERKLGARLVGIRASKHKIDVLKELDTIGLLSDSSSPSTVDDLLDSELIGFLGGEEALFDTSTLPKRDSPSGEVERALREKCDDFEKYEHLFKEKHLQLASGEFALTEYRGLRTIKPGTFFVLGGVIAFIAEVGKSETVNLKLKDEKKQRLRVIFENGTESAMYRQSLAVRMREKNGLAVTRTGFAADEFGDADTETGHLYVLRSLSQHPDIKSLDNLYKIGFSTIPVEQRIRGAEKSATYLMAPVEVVATYRLYNVRPSALEHLVHKLFSRVRLDASIVDIAGGDSVAATEWFLVPLELIDQAVELIGNGDIVNYTYDPASQQLTKVR